MGNKTKKYCGKAECDELVSVYNDQMRDLAYHLVDNPLVCDDETERLLGHLACQMGRLSSSRQYANANDLEVRIMSPGSAAITDLLHSATTNGFRYNLMVEILETFTKKTDEQLRSYGSWKGNCE